MKTEKPGIPKRFLRSSSFQVLLFVITVLYCISPIDFVPDVVPIIGWLDDLGILLVDLIAFIKYLQYRREKTVEEQGTPDSKN